ncbi:polymerase delta-interacting protein 3-like [Anneissia japonica]|uniref:polymerase delta-interacting protein 3-like n=1 Tax=Anneissia japonica TaxID=1529436 RepID=UPI001425709A|nr:polymerase delta-interacting protein 3-like [Anneissia japonica]
MDKSLDEIIKSNRSVGQNKRNFGGRGRGRTRGGFQRGGFQRGGFTGGRGGGRGTNVNPQFGNRGRGNNLHGGAGRGQNRIGRSNLDSQSGSLVVTTQITDARDKLNFKARQTDARVKLIKKAHGVDARQKLQAKRQKSLECTVMPPNQLPVNIDINPSQTRVPSVTITNPQARKRKSTDGVYQTQSGTIQVTRKQQPVSTKFGQKSTGKKKMEVGKMIITTSSDSVSSRMPAGSLKSSSTKTNLHYDEGFAPSAIKFRKTVQAPPPPQITRQPATERLSPLGTRVYVTNLHYSVTEEDIKELFGAIGALRKARFVKQGIAEVVYVNRENALEAINVYNNRELDGIPMQCKLDSSTVPESSSSSSTSSTSAAKSTSRPISDRFKFTRTQSAGIESSGTMRADDVEANLIHKALFKSAASANEPSKPVVFTVKI